MLCELVKLLACLSRFVFIFGQAFTLSLQTPAKTNDIVHISAEFLKMKVFPQLLIPLIAQSIFTCEMLCIYSCP